MKLLITASWVHHYLDEFHSEFPQVEFVGGKTPEELMKAAPDAEVAFGHVSRDIFLTAENLRWIQSPSAGVEWMRHVPELIDSDVIVTNTRGVHAATIAEHTLGMLVFLARNFAALYQAQLEGKWVPWPQQRPSTGLVGLTMGIVGLGQIGRAVAQRAHAFDMKIIAVDAHDVPRPDNVAELRLLDGLPDLLQRSDVVVVATPITEQTRGMIGPDQLVLMQPTAYLLVMSRGGIVHEPTVVQMLREGRLAGAGFDVTEVEPLPADNELWTAPNVFITPHCSPTSEHTRANVAAIMKDNLRRYLAGQPMTNLVDKRLGY